MMTRTIVHAIMFAVAYLALASSDLLPPSLIFHRLSGEG